uniref:Uncharacterized protein n=1 Tax=Ornithorhynchus anatinus TaxID=9258 RepID=A0A6I8NFV4_ORNAN
MYYKFSGFSQRLAGAWASAAYSPQGLRPLDPAGPPAITYAGPTKFTPEATGHDFAAQNRVPELQKFFQVGMAGHGVTSRALGNWPDSRPRARAGPAEGGWGVKGLTLRVGVQDSNLHMVLSGRLRSSVFFPKESRRPACLPETGSPRPDALPDHDGPDRGRDHLLPGCPVYGFPTPEQVRSRWELRTGTVGVELAGLAQTWRR